MAFSTSGAQNAFRALAPDTAGYSTFDYLTNFITGKVDYSRQRALQDIVNNFNANEAQKARDFEERMSSTAYQRAVKDLKAAGLNPALLYSSSGQASTPAGISASGANASAPRSGQAVAQLLSMVLSQFGGYMLEAVRAGNTAAHARRGYSTIYTDGDGVVRGGMSTRYY